MRRNYSKALPLLLACCALSISQAIAAPPEGKGKPDKGKQGNGQGQDKGHGKGKPDKDSHGPGARAASDMRASPSPRHAAMRMNMACPATASCLPAYAKTWRAANPCLQASPRKWSPAPCSPACLFIPATNGG